MPPDIIVVPLERVNWLSADITCGCEVVKLGWNQANKTDFVLLLKSAKRAVDEAPKAKSLRIE